MAKDVIVYKNVFTRDDVYETSFSEYLNNPEDIFEHFELDINILKEIKSISNKFDRNEAKRRELPAMDISQSGLLAIDIDNLIGNKELFDRIVQRLSKLDTCYCVKESVSGNLVAFFKYKCETTKFKFLYYKIYLELTLLLGVNIDFLPEIGRLRYIGEPGFIYLNESSEELLEILDVGSLPAINAFVTPNDARGIVYGSR